MPRVSRQVKIKGFNVSKGQDNTIILGGGSPPVIQTMWKAPLSLPDLEGKGAAEIVDRIGRLENMGCRLIRFAVPNIPSAEVLGVLSSMVSMPLVADIHFDYKIALRCLDFPIAKIRINPGNIGPYGEPVTRKRIEEVLTGANKRGIPIRIGLNSGSLPRVLQADVDSGSIDSAEALVKAAEQEIAVFKEFDFDNFVVSMKSSSVADTIKANRLLAERTDAPFHIGVTEAGPLITGVVRNSVALAALLGEGIGDTIRVSLSDTMEKEVIAGREIVALAHELASPKSLSSGVKIISCPLCGRRGFDTHGFIERWQERLYGMNKNISIAVMGCEVNGPGEAMHADLGITGSGNKVLIFRHGKMVKTVDEDNADAAFEEELNRF